MLFHFPNESPEDLLRKEGEYLEKEIKNAKWVEKHGYRKKEMTLSSFYIEWNCYHKYLGCPIEKWTWPSSSRDKIELEPLPSDFLPPLSTTLRPLKFFDPESGEYVRRIVGFREIQKKREYVEYLLEVELGIGEDDGGGMDDKKGGQVLIDMEEVSEGEESEVDESEGEVEEEESFYKCEPYLRLARGGGKKGKTKDKDKEKDTKKDDDKDDKKGDEKDKKKDKSKKRGKDTGKDKEKDKKGKKEKDAEKKEKGPGIIERIIKYFKGEDDDKGKSKKIDKSKAEKEKDKGKKKQDEKPKKKARETSPQYHKWAISHIWKDFQRQKDQIEIQHQKNLEQIFKYHGLFRVHVTKERDSEWLELSNTDPDQTENEIKTFDKPRDTWMMEAISYESQCLAKTLKFYFIVTSFFGRSFMRVKPDTDKGHMDFTHKKRNVIFFFVTSILLWGCFCLITISFLSIQGENQASEKGGQDQTSTGSRSTKPNNNETDLTLEDIQIRTTKAKHEVEELMLYLYEVPLYVLLANLVLVAIWSILVILGDGIFIAHYFNCWCAALAEMETSGCLGISKVIIVHHIGFTIYACVLVMLFCFDYPKHIRQMNLLISALIMRPLKPYLRIATDDELLPYQIIGMIFQLYVMYCSMLLKLLMAILATILKNASEMWNFKFALTFQQLATKTRGQLLRMGLNHSLLKLFTHHRILTVLLRNYGEVFSIPIMLHMIMEMGVLTIALVRWFFYSEESVLIHYKSIGDHVEIKTLKSRASGNAGQGYVMKESIKIPYYHSKTEVHVILYLMMIQLLYQFMRTQDILARAGDAFFAGYEFVRRSGTILCRNSHQRRLIQSLEWSFSSTNPSVLSANSYYAINRATILSSFAAVAGFFSLIIQLQVEPAYSDIEFLDENACGKFGLELYRGTCVVKDRETLDLSQNFKINDQQRG